MLIELILLFSILALILALNKSSELKWRRQIGDRWGGKALWRPGTATVRWLVADVAGG
jgi:hypothetical protein